MDEAPHDSMFFPSALGSTPSFGHRGSSRYNEEILRSLSMTNLFDAPPFLPLTRAEWEEIRELGWRGEWSLDARNKRDQIPLAFVCARAEHSLFDDVREDGRGGKV
jgi:hypothetical protein